MVWTLCAHTGHFKKGPWWCCGFVLKTKCHNSNSIWWVRSKKGTEQARSLEIASVLRIAYQQKSLSVAGTHKSPSVSVSEETRNAEMCIQAGRCAPVLSPPAPHGVLWLQLCSLGMEMMDGGCRGSGTAGHSSLLPRVHEVMHTPSCAALMAHGPGPLSQLLLSSKKTQFWAPGLQCETAFVWYFVSYK